MTLAPRFASGNAKTAQMIEIATVKRKAKYAGETGLFPVDQEGGDDINRFANDGAVLWVEVTSPENVKLQRLLWAIATKLAQGGLYMDKDEAMDDLKARTGTKSLRRMDRAALSRVADRFVYVVCSELLPGMEESKFRAELEDLLS